MDAEMRAARLPEELADALVEAHGIVDQQVGELAIRAGVHVDRHLPLCEQLPASVLDRAELLHGIERATGGVTLRPDVVEGDVSPDELARELAMAALVNRWRIVITFVTDEDHVTTATATLHAGLDHVSMTGRARKHPADPDDLDVGHELAAGRALLDLGHQLLDIAASRIVGEAAAPGR